MEEFGLRRGVDNWHWRGRWWLGCGCGHFCWYLWLVYSNSSDSFFCLVDVIVAASSTFVFARLMCSPFNFNNDVEILHSFAEVAPWSCPNGDGRSIG